MKLSEQRSPDSRDVADRKERQLPEVKPNLDLDKLVLPNGRGEAADTLNNTSRDAQRFIEGFGNSQLGGDQTQMPEQPAKEKK